MYKKISAVALVFIAGSAAALLVAGVGSSSPPPMPSASQLAILGVTLGAPTKAPPGKTVARAARAAASKKAGADVVNSEYAKCHVPGAVPAVDRNCYVELMNPKQLSSLQGGGPVSWEIVLVDPTTRKPLIGLREEPSQPGAIPTFTHATTTSH
jgi:hypothetical protein